MSLDRRHFLSSCSALFAGSVLMNPTHAAEPWFKISLAQWSLNKALFGHNLDPLDFPRAAKEDYGIAAVEYVNQFYQDKKNNDGYLKELKKRCDGLGIRSLLIMCDEEGALGDPDEKARQKAVENHYRWVEWAKTLGCHSIRVNADAKGRGSPEEQQARAVDGLSKLTEFAAQHDINVIVENHGGLSSNGKWLAGVMKKVNNPRCGTLPDFGNFYEYDRYQGVEDLMPFAKGVSAKSYHFGPDGKETTIDFKRMLAIVKGAGYRGYIGIEYEGDKMSEPDGIRATKKLLEQLAEST